MNQIVKEHLVSAAQTFVAAFLSTLGASISLVGTAEWTSAILVSLIFAAARAAVKEVFARFAPKAFGGRTGPTIFGKRR